MKQVFFLLVITATAFAQSVNVPLDYWGYDFLERCEAKGLYYSNKMKSKPVSRHVFSKVLEEIEQSAKKYPDKFSNTDVQLLKQLKGDFAEELERDSNDEIHLYSYRVEQSAFHVDFVGQQAVNSLNGDSHNPDELQSESTAGAIVRGQLGNAVGFYVNAYGTLTKSNVDAVNQFDVSQGLPVVSVDGISNTDNAIVYFVWEKPWLRIQFGKDELNWGPSFKNNLSISQNMPPADMLRLGINLHNFYFSSTHAVLSSALGQKYITAHRLDWQITRGVVVGVSESVVYGGRDIEWSYINPLMIYHVAEHHLGDLDNNTMSFDFSINRFAGMKFYGEFFIDDMTVLKNWLTYYGNKWGASIGTLWPDAFGVSDLDVRCEYTRIEPYVYSNDDTLAIYTNYDQIIGNPLGSNADAFWANLTYRFNRDWRLDASFEHRRKGTGQPNTIDEPPLGSQSKEFLGDDYESQNILGIETTWQIKRDFFINFSYFYKKTENPRFLQTSLATDHIIRLQGAINY